MFRGIRKIGVLAAVLAIGAAPAAAQRTNTSGETTGTAVSRGGDGGDGGGGMSRPADPGPSSSPGGVSSGGDTGGTWSPPSPAPTRVNPVVPSVQPVERQQRRGGSRDDGGSAPAAERPRAVPRDSAGSDGAPRPRSTDRSAGATADANGESGAASSRTRGTRPRTGTAVDRRDVPPSAGRDWNRYYPVYPHGRYYWPGYGFGLGYFFDPLWYDPYFYGGGYYGGGSYGGGSYGGGGYGSASYAKGPSGSLRLKIEPKDAEVYVDGYYAGLVNDFDGIFQKLTVEAGARRIEIRAAGYEPVQIDVLVKPGETITYEGNLERQP